MTTSRITSKIFYFSIKLTIVLLFIAPLHADFVVDNAVNTTQSIFGEEGGESLHKMGRLPRPQ